MSIKSTECSYESVSGTEESTAKTCFMTASKMKFLQELPDELIADDMENNNQSDDANTEICTELNDDETISSFQSKMESIDHQTTPRIVSKETATGFTQDKVFNSLKRSAPEDEDLIDISSHSFDKKLVKLESFQMQQDADVISISDEVESEGFGIKMEHKMMRITDGDSSNLSDQNSSKFTAKQNNKQFPADSNTPASHDIDPEKASMFQQHLTLLFHTLDCRLKNESPESRPNCPVANCDHFKVVIEHMMTCNDMNSCSVLYCNYSKKILTHWKYCSNTACPICNDPSVLQMAATCKNIPLKVSSHVSSAGVKSQVFESPYVAVKNQAQQIEPTNDLSSAVTEPSSQIFTANSPICSDLPIQVTAVESCNKMEDLIDDPTSGVTLVHSSDAASHTPVRQIWSQKKLYEMFSPILRIIAQLEPDSRPFLQPVNAVEESVPDYYDVIKKPMDLSTLCQKLNSGEHYTNPWHIIDDFWQMIHNAWLYNRKNTKVYKSATKLSNVFDERATALMIEHHFCCAKTYYFTPLALYCVAKDYCVIPRESWYYELGDLNIFCAKCFEEIKGDSVNITDDDSGQQRQVSKSLFRKLKNDKIEKEPYVTCTECGITVHEICVLHFVPVHGKLYRCPRCVAKKKLVKHVNRFTAKQLPVTNLSGFIEKRVNEFLQKQHASVQYVHVRVVANVQKFTEVKPLIRKNYASEGYPERFPYRSKALFVFEEIDGVDLCFFGMHVQEYGNDCPEPNKNRVYLSYLDSVHYFQPSFLRTAVYHEILLAYFQFCLNRGFQHVHVWSCAPCDGDDYMFHCHPPEQRVPKRKRLFDWYKILISKGINGNIFVEFKDMYRFATEDMASKPNMMPYFDGDYWPGMLEDAISECEKEESELNQRISSNNQSFGAGNSQGKGISVSPTSSSSLQNCSVEASDCVNISETNDSCQQEESVSSSSEPMSKIARSKKAKRSKNAKKKSSSPGDVLTVSQRVVNTANRYREDFFVIALNSANVTPQEDPDPIMPCDLMDGRSGFFNISREKNWEYSSLRRAKHSTMGMLMELHTGCGERYLFNCNRCECKLNSRLHCDTCTDFDLCSRCFDEVGHEHPLHEIAASQDLSFLSQSLNACSRSRSQFMDTPAGSRASMESSSACVADLLNSDSLNDDTAAKQNQHVDYPALSLANISATPDNNYHNYALGAAAAGHSTGVLSSTSLQGNIQGAFSNPNLAAPSSSKDVLPSLSSVKSESGIGSTVELFATLEHAVSCMIPINENCPVSCCTKMKRVVTHFRDCIQKDLVTSCPRCRMILPFINNHSRICKNGRCKVPLCEAFKERMRINFHRDRFDQELMVRRRVALMQMQQSNRMSSVTPVALQTTPNSGQVCEESHQPSLVVAGSTPQLHPTNLSRSVTPSQQHNQSNITGGRLSASPRVNDSSSHLELRRSSRTAELLHQQQQQSTHVIPGSSGMDSNVESMISHNCVYPTQLQISEPGNSILSGSTQHHYPQEISVGGRASVIQGIPVDGSTVGMMCGQMMSQPGVISNLQKMTPEQQISLQGISQIMANTPRPPQMVLQQNQFPSQSPVQMIQNAVARSASIPVDHNSVLSNANARMINLRQQQQTPVNAQMAHMHQHQQQQQQSLMLNHLISQGQVGMNQLQMLLNSQQQAAAVAAGIQYQQQKSVHQRMLLAQIQQKIASGEISPSLFQHHPLLMAAVMGGGRTPTASGANIQQSEKLISTQPIAFAANQQRNPFSGGGNGQPNAPNQHHAMMDSQNQSGISNVATPMQQRLSQKQNFIAHQHLQNSNPLVQSLVAQQNQAHPSGGQSAVMAATPGIGACVAVTQSENFYPGMITNTDLSALLQQSAMSGNAVGRNPNIVLGPRSHSINSNNAIQPNNVPSQQSIEQKSVGTGGDFFASNLPATAVGGYMTGNVQTSDTSDSNGPNSILDFLKLLAQIVSHLKPSSTLIQKHMAATCILKTPCLVSSIGHEAQKILNNFIAIAPYIKAVNGLNVLPETTQFIATTNALCGHFHRIMNEISSSIPNQVNKNNLNVPVQNNSGSTGLSASPKFNMGNNNGSRMSASTGTSGQMTLNPNANYHTEMTLQSSGGGMPTNQSSMGMHNPMDSRNSTPTNHMRAAANIQLGNVMIDNNSSTSGMYVTAANMNNNQAHQLNNVVPQNLSMPFHSQNIHQILNMQNHPNNVAASFYSQSSASTPDSVNQQQQLNAHMLQNMTVNGNWNRNVQVSQNPIAAVSTMTKAMRGRAIRQQLATVTDPSNFDLSAVVAQARMAGNSGGQLNNAMIQNSPSAVGNLRNQMNMMHGSMNDAQMLHSNEANHNLINSNNGSRSAISASTAAHMSSVSNPNMMNPIDFSAALNLSSNNNNCNDSGRGSHPALHHMTNTGMMSHHSSMMSEIGEDNVNSRSVNSNIPGADGKNLSNTLSMNSGISLSPNTQMLASHQHQILQNNQMMNLLGAQNYFRNRNCAPGTTNTNISNAFDMNSMNRGNQNILMTMRSNVNQSPLSTPQSQNMYSEEGLMFDCKMTSPNTKNINMSTNLSNVTDVTSTADNEMEMFLNKFNVPEYNDLISSTSSMADGLTTDNSGFTGSTTVASNSTVVTGPGSGHRNDDSQRGPV